MCEAKNQKIRAKEYAARRAYAIRAHTLTEREREHIYKQCHLAKDVDLRKDALATFKVERECFHVGVIYFLVFDPHIVLFVLSTLLPSHVSEGAVVYLRLS
jgi:hypothetical protein